MYERESEPGLGLAPVIVAAAIPFVIGGVAHFLQSSDPAKDQLRFARNENWFQAALAGDGHAEARLRCAAGEDMRAVLPLTELANGGCRLAAGSSPSRQQAQMLVAALPVQQTTGPAGARPIGPGPSLFAGLLPTTGPLSNPWLIGGVVVGAYLMTRKRGR